VIKYYIKNLKFEGTSLDNLNNVIEYLNMHKDETEDFII
jgi:hypothetical protein